LYRLKSYFSGRNLAKFRPPKKKKQKTHWGKVNLSISTSQISFCASCVATLIMTPAPYLVQCNDLHLHLLSHAPTEASSAAAAVCNKTLLVLRSQPPLLSPHSTPGSMDVCPLLLLLLPLSWYLFDPSSSSRSRDFFCVSIINLLVQIIFMFSAAAKVIRVVCLVQQLSTCSRAVDVPAHLGGGVGETSAAPGCCKYLT